MKTLIIGMSAVAISIQAASAEMQFTQPADVGMSAKKLAAVKPAVQKLVESESIPGAIVVVARRGKIVLFDAVGFATSSPTNPCGTIRSSVFIQ